MMNFEEIVKSLQDRRIDIVSKAVGLHYHTVREIKNGINTNPSRSTMEKLSNYFEAQQHE